MHECPTNKVSQQGFELPSNYGIFVTAISISNIGIVPTRRIVLNRLSGPLVCEIGCYPVNGLDLGPALPGSYLRYRMMGVRTDFQNDRGPNRILGRGAFMFGHAVNYANISTFDDLTRSKSHNRTLARIRPLARSITEQLETLSCQPCSCAGENDLCSTWIPHHSRVYSTRVGGLRCVASRYSGYRSRAFPSWTLEDCPSFTSEASRSHWNSTLCLLSARPARKVANQRLR